MLSIVQTPLKPGKPKKIVCKMMILTVIQSKVIYILNLYASVNQIHAFLIPPKKRIVFLKPHNRSIDQHSEGNID